jgi:hypothetical protein
MMVLILFICLFVRAFCQIWGKKKLSLSFPSQSPLPDLPTPTGSPSHAVLSHASFYSSDHKEPKSNLSSLRANVKIRLDNTEIQLSLHYLCKSDTEEVNKFVKCEKIARMMVKKGGILYNKSCIMNSQSFAKAAGFCDISGLLATHIHVFSCVVERWSPLAYSIASWIHSDVAHHAGYKTCFRQSHSHARAMNQTNSQHDRSNPCDKFIQTQIQNKDLVLKDAL